MFHGMLYVNVKANLAYKKLIEEIYRRPDIQDDWSVSGGLRYTRDNKHFRGNIFNLSPATLPDPDPLPSLPTCTTD